MATPSGISTARTEKQWSAAIGHRQYLYREIPARRRPDAIIASDTLRDPRSISVRGLDPLGPDPKQQQGQSRPDHHQRQQTGAITAGLLYT
jgi:hypothetical protein